MTMDWAPTFLEAASVSQSNDAPMDGRSLLPVLTDPAHTFALDASQDADAGALPSGG